MWLDIGSWTLHASGRRNGTRYASVEMHYVGQVDWSFTDQPAPASPTSMGLSRLRIVGPDQGAVHTEAAVGALAAGGWLGRHIHSFEEALYVLAGELTPRHRRTRPPPPGGRLRAHGGRDLARARERRGPNRSAGSRSTRRSGSIRPGGRRDTFFRDGPLDVARLAARAVRPPSAIRRSGRSVTTTARRRRPRRCASPTRPTVARRPGWTWRSLPTAGSR